MKPYRFARVYLSALLVCAACVVFVGGIASFIALGYGLLAFGRAASLLRETPSFDSATVQKLVTDIPVLLQPVFQGQKPPAIPSAPETDGFPLGTCTPLTLTELHAFRNYLLSAQAYSRDTKASMVARFDDAIGTLIASAERSLPQAARPLSPGSIDAPPSRILHFFELGSVTESAIEELTVVSTFLQEGTQRYTPSQQARDLTGQAEKNVQQLLQLLARERELQNQLRRVSSLAVPPDVTSPPEPSAKAELISEFIEQLRTCRELVHRVALQNWQVDGVLESALDRVQTRIDHVARESRSERRVGLLLLAIAAVTLLGSIIVALVLMAFRDFMSAVIDTATHAASIDTRLASLEVSPD